MTRSIKIHKFRHRPSACWHFLPWRALSRDGTLGKNKGTVTRIPSGYLHRTNDPKPLHQTQTRVHTHTHTHTHTLSIFKAMCFACVCHSCVFLQPLFLPLSLSLSL